MANADRLVGNHLLELVQFTINGDLEVTTLLSRGYLIGGSLTARPVAIMAEHCKFLNNFDDKFRIDHGSLSKHRQLGFIVLQLRHRRVLS